MDQVFDFNAGFGVMGLRGFLVAEGAGKGDGFAAGCFETGEEGSPVGVDGVGVGLILLVELVDVVGVCPVDEVQRFHGRHEP